jgi:hypothetical protein
MNNGDDDFMRYLRTTPWALREFLEAHESIHRWPGLRFWWLYYSCSYWLQRFCGGTKR